MNILFLSVASVWEIVIKTKSGKLTLPEPVEEYIPNRLALNRFESLDIQMTHTLQVANLPNIHRDPFDRILIAQSQVENLPIVTIDQKIAQYSVETIW
ncbi:type II toxin-antitoxin system VapC family toxin [Nostoc sp. CALU 546]|uniref:type II toxin-antitoxin system VapC family toxin n=1 Tax=Nostoc sp. CALU 546 TaxID=1867241 RepID=UPI003B67E095